MVKIFNLNFFRWLIVQSSCLSMVFAPVALGKEAERFNKSQLSQIVAEVGLDKKTTLGEFWEKSKASMPGYVYRDLEAFVAANKNLLMPEVSLSTAKGGNGQEVPVIRFTQNGKTQTAQIFDEPARWATFNGVGLSGSDIGRVEDAFKRVTASDIKFRSEADKFREEKISKQISSSIVLKTNEYKRDFSRFAGFPRVTPQMWQGLSVEQRAGYIVKMQLMAMNARKVLAMIPDKKNSPAKPKDSAALENFYKVIFSQPVQAEAGKVTPSAAVRVQGTSVRTKKGVVNIPYTANTCVVAGYIGAYGTVTNVSGANRSGCSVDVAVATYKSNESLKFVQEANDTCAAEKSTLIACNPIIYGFPAGKPACIDRTSAEYQHATHFKSPANKDTCDGKSKLASTDEIIQFNDKDYSNVQPREKQIAAIEADQKKDDYALTQSYIKGVLSKRDPLMIAMLEKGEWNLGLDEELVKIQSQFEQEIERAIKTCENEITAKHEPNQKLACDQLHRRWLFTERAIASLRDKACVKPALYIGSYAAGESSYADTAKEKTALNKKTIDAKGLALCECPGATKVDFAQSCPVTAVVEPVPVPAPEPASADVSPPAPKCDKPQGIAGFDYEKCKCEDGKKLKQVNGEATAYECEGSNWLPWALGGLGLLALVAIFNKSKKPPQPPTPPEGCKNICTVGVLNPSTCACAVVPPAPLCPAPKVGIPPNCACPAAPTFCTLPQKIYDTSTCQCTNRPGPVICPNNSEAPMGNLSQCPKCADGSYKTTTGCPSEGGTGNNTCKNPPCSGGLPGTGQ